MPVPWQLMKMGRKVQYYETFSDDIIKIRNQDYRLPEDYRWERQEWWYRISSAILYRIAWALGLLYCKVGIHASVRDGKVLEDYQDTGYFLYANHTQPVGDVFLPVLARPAKRIYTIVSPANLGLPFLGRLLPLIGALPVSGHLGKMKLFTDAVKKRLKEGKCIVIYPEAHVWPYYTKIRPFPDTSFWFPVETGAPSFVMTTTYQKRKRGKRPQITLYVNGPFFPDEELPKKQRQKKLRDEVQDCMKKRCLSNTYEYIHYRKKGERDE